MAYYNSVTGETISDEDYAALDKTNYELQYEDNPWDKISGGATSTSSTSTTSTSTNTTTSGNTTVTTNPDASTIDGSIPNDLAVQTGVQQLSTRDTVVNNVVDPSVPESGIQTYTALETGDIAGGSQFQEGQAMEATTPMEYVEASTSTAAAPGSVTASGYEATTVTGETPVMNAAMAYLQTTEDGKTVSGITTPDQVINNATATVDADGNPVQPLLTADLPTKALMSEQLNQLLSALEGGNIPAWARPAVDAVEDALQRRGLSKSSIGRDALFNAIIQSALPIAKDNADKEFANAQQNLAAQQQAFLQNLTNEQQARVLSYQAKVQTLLSDQSAQNAAKQFNATNQQQVDLFMEQLRSQTEQFNAQQANAMEQFNAGNEMSVSQFNAQLEFNREQFNVQMYNAIEQSNVQWRRQMNQIDTAGVNAVNQANAINAFNLSNQALTMLWQDLRDSANWSFQAGENDQERQTRMALAALANESDKNQLDLATWQAVGGFIASIL